MSLWRQRSLRSKIALITAAVLVVCFTLSAVLTYRQQRQTLVDEAVDKARQAASQAIRTRDYLSSQLSAGDVTLSDQRYGLIPVVASNRIGSQVAADLGYSIRQTSLRYRNPQNAPDPYERAALERFVTEPGLAEQYAIVETDRRLVFRYLQPFAADQSCLLCHSDPARAPQFIRERFPPERDQAYHYRLGEVIGAVSVSIPMARLERQMHLNLRHSLLVSGGIFLTLVIGLSLLTRQAVLQPLSRLAASISEITRTGRFGERLDVRTGGEIGQLITGFNEMMAQVEEKTAHLEESERRFRLLTELARDAIVAFLPGGQIFLVNRQAERIFGYSQRELLGAPFDRLIHESSREFEGGLVELLAVADADWLSRLHHVTGRRCDGSRVELEVSVAIVDTGERPFYTAILRELH